MKSKTFFLIAIGAIFVVVSNGAPLISDEKEAREFAADFSQKVNIYSERLSNVTISPESQSFSEMAEKLNIVLNTLTKTVNLVDESKKFDYKNFKDNELKNVFYKIKTYAEEAVVGNEEFMQILASLGTLQNLPADKVISYKNENISLAYFPDVQNIFASSNDQYEILHYWTWWRLRNAKLGRASFVTMIQGLQHAANLTGISPYEYMMKNHDLKKMEEVLSQIEPFHLQIHGFIRSKLNRKYGDSAVKLDGLIPDHLFRQVLAQSWTDGSIIDDMYPYKDLPPFDSLLEQNHFDTLKMYKMADQFYQSLGFEPIPDNYWGTKLQMKSPEDKGDCKPMIFDYTVNVLMKYCPKMDFRKFLQAHGYMGELYYAREKADLPAYYFKPHDLQYPVGEAVKLSAATPKHLNAVGIVSDVIFTDEVMMNRLIRSGIQTMLNIRLYYVHTRVLADLFTGVVEMNDLNKHYWKLMDKYVGVGPPVNRDSDDFDFPYTFYNDLNENPRMFDSQVLGYQFYKKMCTISGQYPKEPLQNCDFYGSKEVGNALKKMMKLGSSKTLTEVLEVFLPENPKVDADSLLEYYRPVQVWLTEKNHEAEVKLGWTHLDKRIESFNRLG